MKEFWVRVVPWDKGLVTSAIEAGADVIWVEDGLASRVKELGVVKVASSDGDVKPSTDFEVVVVDSKEAEERALELSKSRKVVVEASDWKVIPLENLVAQSDNIYVVVRGLDDAEMALGVLEKGVKGVVLETNDPSVVKEVGRMVKRSHSALKLEEAEILEVKQVGMGYRVCVDTTELMSEGEGMLVGDKSSFFFLVHAESVENPYVAPRPFRVNAGGVHAYILAPYGKTRYLSEIETGDKVWVVNHRGEVREAVVGRSKTEVRPLMLVRARVGDVEGTLILQNAETIRLTSPDGKPLSVVKLKRGDKVLAHVTEAGRHFGVKVKENIKER
ncbi:MAG: 3-dehydroquinate synthase II [Deferribacteres bacterium]|nr:3-dehydroquinate synthase II [Deferribacteres bacterium]